MKISVTVTILVLVASATFGWHQRIALNHLHDMEQALLANATNLTAGAKSGGAAGTPDTRMSRANRETEARTTAARLIAALKEVGIQAPGEEYQVVEKRIEKVLDQMYHMNGLQLRVMIEEFRNCPHLEDNWWRNQSIGAAIDALADTDPKSAMAVLTDMAGQLGDSSDRFDHVIGKWASTDPLAALAWMRGEKIQGSRAFVIGLAAKDPKLAFQSLVEFKAYTLHGSSREFEGGLDFDAAKQIARTARTLEERSNMLGILRELADNAGDDPDHVIQHTVQKALMAMAEGIPTYGYARASVWLESLDLRPGEAAQLMNGLRIAEARTKGEAGQWFEWMGEHLSPKEFELPAMQMGEWVIENPQAVEKWLAQAPDGPAKRMAVSTYAVNVAARQAEPEPHSEPTPGTYPVASAVDGRPGFVTSPFTGKIIEVTGTPSGTLVADPTFPSSEKKYFRIP
ncbi:MAG: hypothetical protein NTW21_31015 [Verrucomicrobia bacterium]|nr:hypothetical protein [Verrucomicrobiota bacterium]